MRCYNLIVISSVLTLPLTPCSMPYALCLPKSAIYNLKSKIHPLSSACCLLLFLRYIEGSSYHPLRSLHLIVWNDKHG